MNHFNCEKSTSLSINSQHGLQWWIENIDNSFRNIRTPGEDLTIHNDATILDINYVDFLQFQRYFIPQAELEEAFIYIIHKPIDFSIDFSYRLKT